MESHRAVVQGLQMKKEENRKKARPGDYDGVGAPDAPGSAPTVTSEEEKESMIVILFFCKQRYMYLIVIVLILV